MSSQQRIVIGWHACLEAIKVRPHEIIRIYLEEETSLAKQHSKTNTDVKFKNSRNQNSNEQLKTSLKLKQNAAFNGSDKYDFLIKGQLKSKVTNKPKSFFEKWGTGHQGIALEIESFGPYLDINTLIDKKSVLIALDEIEDPTNLGNLLRTSWLLGVDGLLITQDRSVKLTPQVCKIASGGAEHVPVEVVHPLSNTLEDYKKMGFWVYGLDANAEKTIYDIDFSDKVILVAGNEGKGLRKTTQNVCDEFIKIPQVTESASLNVATSLAITLSQVHRAFLKPKSS